MARAGGSSPPRRGLRLCALTVDLDEIPCYSAIHGLPALAGEAAHAVYRRGLPRLLRLFEELGVPATWFAIGRDLDDPRAQQSLSRAAQSGHEIGNHSFDHHYALSRRSPGEIRAQIQQGADAIERAIGRRPRGFRAPGYTINDRVFEALAELGVRYDSSVFPCPGYYALKTGAIVQYRLRGRPTHSVIDDPRVLRAPAEPYRIGRPYYLRGSGLWELPIGVTRDRFGRLPYIGTSVLASRLGARLLTAAIAGRSLVNLELHGLDALDASDGLASLATSQLDLRLPAPAKLAQLRAIVLDLRARGYEFVTLDDAVSRFEAFTAQPG